MNKRIFSWLLCAGLVLGMIPGGIVLSASGASTGVETSAPSLQNSISQEGENNMYLELTEDGTGYCPVCRKNVKWTPVRKGTSIGGLPLDTKQHHYYFSDDNMSTDKELEFLTLTEGNAVCLHLNGKTVNMFGNFMVNGGTLNLIGDGYVDFQSKLSDAHNNSVFLSAKRASRVKAINIYGGTYTSSTGKPILVGTGGSYSTRMIVKLYGNAKLDGSVSLDQGQIYLYDAATVKEISATNSVSVRVDENWSGSATVDYFADYTGDFISAYNGRSTGSFTGKLMLADGRQLVGESGKLRIVETDAWKQNNPDAGTSEKTEKTFWQSMK